MMFLPQLCEITGKWPCYSWAKALLTTGSVVDQFLHVAPQNPGWMMPLLAVLNRPYCFE